MEAWFEKGKEYPRIHVLKVKAQDAHYWNNNTSKLITFFKLAASIISVQKLDMGREGELNV